MVNRKVITAIIVSITFMTACEKNKGPVTVKELLTMHKWKLVSQKSHGQFVQEDTCGDNVTIIKSDNTGYLKLENNKCAGRQSYSDAFHWQLSPANDTFFLEFKYNMYALSIIELNEKKLVMSYFISPPLYRDTGTIENIYEPMP